MKYRNELCEFSNIREVDRILPCDSDSYFLLASNAELIYLKNPLFTDEIDTIG